MTEPTNADVDRVLFSLAAQSLAGKPVGTTAMATECCGVKKMGFVWMVRVFGLRKAIGFKISDWKTGRVK